MDGIERSHETAKSDQSDSDPSDVDSDVVEMGVDDDAMERKSARFTQYSLSSSVVPRSEGEFGNYDELPLMHDSWSCPTLFRLEGIYCIVFIIYIKLTYLCNYISLPCSFNTFG